MDEPLTPDQKGFEAMRRRLVGETPALRKQWRQQVLATAPADFKAFGLRLSALTEEGGMNCVVFGSKAAIEAANAELTHSNKPPLIVREIL